MPSAVAWVPQAPGMGNTLPTVYPGAFDMLVFSTSKNPGSISDEKVRHRHFPIILVYRKITFG